MNWSLFWTIIGAISALIIVPISYYLHRKERKNSEAQMRKKHLMSVIESLYESYEIISNNLLETFIRSGSFEDLKSYLNDSSKISADTNKESTAKADNKLTIVGKLLALYPEDSLSVIHKKLTKLSADFQDQGLNLYEGPQPWKDKVAALGKLHYSTEKLKQEIDDTIERLGL